MSVRRTRYSMRGGRVRLLHIEETPRVFSLSPARVAFVVHRVYVELGRRY
jgi:hypothetical protein